ncbi:MAG: tRNA lysidine(34) synthetase TilS, partial [Gammaproteobacteria bacterium]|nr:tRNA lysidine(34) synthetase TilS [Gammaproteobacteria bacterium]
MAFSSANLREFLIPFVQEQQRLFVAFSGGLDSSVLLHALAQLHLNNAIEAVYVDHGLQTVAQQWPQQCQLFCDQLGVSLTVLTVDAGACPGESPEAAARQARYQAFAEMLPEKALLLTAHHLDDQAETFLLQALRGAGTRGLSAMPVQTVFAQGKLLRPLLEYSREDLLHYATLHKFTWIDDPSNQSLQYDRNYLRQHIMPLLKSRWPGSAKSLARAAEHCASSETLNQNYAQQLLANLTKTNQCLSVKALLNLERSHRFLVLRAWIVQHGFVLPSAKKLQHIDKNVLAAKNDAQPCVHWDKVEVRRYADDLYIMHTLQFPSATEVYTWDGTGELSIPNLGKISFKATEGIGLDPEKLRKKVLKICFA